VVLVRGVPVAVALARGDVLGAVLPVAIVAVALAVGGVLGMALAVGDVLGMALASLRVVLSRLVVSVRGPARGPGGAFAGRERRPRRVSFVASSRRRRHWNEALDGDRHDLDRCGRSRSRGRLDLRLDTVVPEGRRAPSDARGCSSRCPCRRRAAIEVPQRPSRRRGVQAWRPCFRAAVGRERRPRRPPPAPSQLR
jgi:hypothetical protein